MNVQSICNYFKNGIKDLIPIGIVMLFAISLSFGQNLVINPSFEQSQIIQFTDYSEGARHGEEAIEEFNGLFPGWSCPGWLGKPSVHSSDNINEPYTKAQNGKNAVGLTTYAPASDDHNFHAYDYVDFLVGSFGSTIEANQNYYIEFWIKRQQYWLNREKRIACCRNKNEDKVNDISHVHLLVAASNFGMLLIPDSMAFAANYTKHAKDRTLLQKEVQPHFNYCDLLELDTGWCKIQGVFTAPFAASHFALGNFFTAEETQSSVSEADREIHKTRSTQKVIKDERIANYFIDNIVIRPADSLEFDVFRDNNCLLRSSEVIGKSEVSALKVYQPTHLNTNPQRTCYIGNYKHAFTEKWTDCLGNFPKEYTDSLLKENFQLAEAKPVVINQAKQYDILCINEAHVHSEHRAFLYNLLDSLYDIGYRYLFLEALNPAIDLSKLNSKMNYPKINWGAYVRDPTFAAAINKAKMLGMKIFPYEPNEQETSLAYEQLLVDFPEAKKDTSGWYMTPDGVKHTLAMGELTFSARDKAMADNIFQVLSRLPKGKTIVYGGGGHMNKTPCGYIYSLAYWLGKLTGKPLLSINQNTLPRDYDSISITVPTVIRKGDAYFYNNKICYENGKKEKRQKNDVTVIHPYYDRKDQQRPDWLSLSGERMKVELSVPDDMPTPFVAIVYRRGQDIQNDVPVDAVEYAEKVEEIEIFISGKGCYDVLFISETRIEKVGECF